jgi:hypothetical protein
MEIGLNHYELLQLKAREEGRQISLPGIQIAMYSVSYRKSVIFRKTRRAIAGNGSQVHLILAPPEHLNWNSDSDHVLAVTFR